MRSHDLGRASEDLACDFLVSRGWHVLDRNYRAGHKEIDIVGARNAVIAFVEVKARSSVRHGHPLHAIDWRKCRELKHAARAWIRAHPRPGFDFRFDAITVIWTHGRGEVEHVEDAWRL